MSTVIHNQKIFNFKLSFFILIFTFLILSPLQVAHAGLLIQRPLYIGLGSGLVGSWSFDGPDMAGTTAFDRSGQSNNGTLTNGPARAIGRIGQALEFDGSNDLVDIDGVTGEVSVTNGAISAWIKLDSGIIDEANGTNRPIVVMIVGAGVNGHISLVKQGLTGADRLSMIYRKSGVAQDLASLNDITGFGDTWKHIVGVWDASNIYLYVNGVLQATTARAADTGALTLADIGNGESCSGGACFDNDFFDGLIDEVRVYNRALSADEIKRLHKIGATFIINKARASVTATSTVNVSLKTAPSSGLVGYWSFDGPDMANVTAFDRSGNANNGTLTNGPARAIGRIGQAMEFDGVNDLVNMGDVLDFTTANMTISAWIYPRSLGELSKGAIVTKNPSAAGGYHMRLKTNNVFEFQVKATSVDSNTNAIALNVWQHVVVTYDGVTSRFYKNSTAVGTPALTAVLTGNAEDLQIGGQGGAETFDGLIDEVRVYNRVLSSNEIKRLYNMGR